MSTTQWSFAPLATQKKFSLTMLIQPLARLPKDDPMQIDKIRFKPFIK
jgi:hypothetical protein